jgi:Tfp pilus assembly protein PilZ/ActR/RegA family two-component response regulator
VSNRPLLVMGLADAAMLRVREAGEAAGVPVTTLPESETASAYDVDELAPLAILLRLDAPRAAEACAHVRSNARLAQVPIFGVADELSDLAFTELFVWGGDDLVGLTSALPLTRRLRGLRAGGNRSAALSSEKPQAVVAGQDGTWRTVMGRALYNGGFSVRFAVSVEGLVSESLAEGISVAVVSDDLVEGGAHSALSDLRRRGSKTACILVAPPKRMAAATASLQALGQMSVADGFAPPENVLFLVNELLAPRGVDKRAAARLLYGTAVAFRVAGRDADEIGFSYNVSAGGLYIRTLAPPDPGQELWLEMWSPRSERRVRLVGTVAWRRPFGNIGGATVPAGFGLKITEGLAGDFERWKAGYEAFAKSLLGT